MNPVDLPIVVFYNVENLFDNQDDRSIRGDDAYLPDGELLWDANRYEKKLNSLANALSLFRNEPPGLIGLCEVENRRVLEDLIKQAPLSEKQLTILHEESEDPRGMDCALIFDPAVFTLLQHRAHLVQVPGEKYFRTRDMLEAQFRVGETELVVFVNHWPSRKEGEQITFPRRKAAASLLRKRIDEILAENPLNNILVMGDFNDKPTDKTVHEILRAKGQHELKQGDLVNLLIEEEKEDLGTHIFRDDWMVFDQLIVSQGLLQGRNGLEIQKINAFILKDERLFIKRGNKTVLNTTYAGERYVGGYSDHLPVYLRITVKTKKA
jgi:predicted extracellular nuclease